MLVLTRRIGEAIVLDDGVGTKIRIYIPDIRGKQVSIGIDAPRHIKILREELCEPSMMRERESTNTT